jgi:hypothetical protein
MRIYVLLVCAAISLNSAKAEALSDADRETLLENLEQLQESADSKVDAKFRVALAAYREAIGSDDAAMELYLNCIEKVNFEDQQKKSTDFREWKRSQVDKLADPGLRLALRHQLRWLVLTLQASSEKADRTKLIPEAQQIVDSIFLDTAKLRNQQETLNQSVTSSVFARAYEINSAKVEMWPLSPISLDQVYEQILLPPNRKSSRLNQLQATWTKRIQQESAKVQYWSEHEQKPKDEKRVGMASEMQNPAYEKFLTQAKPSLQWEMELDLFSHGDESGAAVRMMNHLQKNLTHPSVRQWAKQFGALLKPKTVEAPPTAQAPTP